MTKKSSTITKRSIATYSVKERQEMRAKVMKEVASSKEAATKFLQEVGILDKEGNVSKHYK